jgi:hypothetical protein
VVREKITPRNQGKDTVNASHGQVALLITPSVAMPVKMELLELKLLDEVIEERDQEPVESRTVFVGGHVDEVEIHT